MNTFTTSPAEVTAKDFRILAATATAAERLSALTPALSPTDRKRQVAYVMRDIALCLANTPAVVRKSYVHPRLVEAFHDGTLSGMATAVGRRPSMSGGEAIITDLFADAG